MDERTAFRLALYIEIDATKKKHALAVQTPKAHYEQGRADAARVILAAWNESDVLDRYGETIYAPGALIDLDDPQSAAATLRAHASPEFVAALVRELQGHDGPA